WQASYQANDAVVLLVNHSKSAKSVDVTWREPCDGASVEVGLSQLTTTKRSRTTVFGLSVPPEDLALIRISK
ncbi:MAG TPA: hypothetical protein VHV83_15365, partial [Armatimonadota bacterium]|nr:hypothetical protein [Armatimonadota bacterium]